MHATNTCTYLTARLSLELNLVSREMKKTIRFNKIEREIQKTDLGSLKDKNETKNNLDLIPQKNQEQKKKTCKRKNARNRMAVSREKLFSESASSLRDPPPTCSHSAKKQKLLALSFLSANTLGTFTSANTTETKSKGENRNFFFFLLWCLQSSSYQSITLYFLSISWAVSIFILNINRSFELHIYATCHVIN